VLIAGRIQYPAICLCRNTKSRDGRIREYVFGDVRDIKKMLKCYRDSPSLSTAVLFKSRMACKVSDSDISYVPQGHSKSEFIPEGCLSPSGTSNKIFPRALILNDLSRGFKGRLVLTYKEQDAQHGQCQSQTSLQELWKNGGHP
jgi:hypothetical protein